MNYQPETALPQRLLSNEEMQRALAGHDFGTVFRLARNHAGISYSRIAAACDIKPQRVGMLARGEGRITTFDKVVEIADALRIPGRMVGLAPRPWETGDAPAHPYAPEIRSTSVRRRTVLQAATSAGLAAALPALHRLPAPKHVTVSDVDQMQQRTARLRRLDDILGGGDTYRVYLGEYQSTKALLRDATFTPESRRHLVALLAEQAHKPDGPPSTAGGALMQKVSTRRVAPQPARQATAISSAMPSRSSPTRRPTGARPWKSP
ncbi:helix-turn-helix domain-containing protein [Streptomyces sp. NPDC001275]